MLRDVQYRSSFKNVLKDVSFDHPCPHFKFHAFILDLEYFGLFCAIFGLAFYCLILVEYFMYHLYFLISIFIHPFYWIMFNERQLPCIYFQLYVIQFSISSYLTHYVHSPWRAFRYTCSQNLKKSINHNILICLHYVSYERTLLDPRCYFYFLH